MNDFTVPKEVYESDKACAEFILRINEMLAKVSEMEKKLKAAKEEAANVMLSRLEATGQKHFAFEEYGTFSKRTSVKISFPTAESGGKEAAVEWLTAALRAGVIDPEQLLDLQQARLVTEPVLAVEEAVEAYNQKQLLNGGTPLPPSPFNKFELVTLSAPRKRKGA